MTVSWLGSPENGGPASSSDTRSRSCEKPQPLGSLPYPVHWTCPLGVSTLGALSTVRLESSVPKSLARSRVHRPLALALAPTMFPSSRLTGLCRCLAFGGLAAETTRLCQTPHTRLSAVTPVRGSRTSPMSPSARMPPAPREPSPRNHPGPKAVKLVPGALAPSSNSSVRFVDLDR